MRKYICFVNLIRIVEADTKEQACEKFVEYHDFEDLYPDVKEFRKSLNSVKIKLKNKNSIK